MMTSPFFIMKFTMLFGGRSSPWRAMASPLASGRRRSGLRRFRDLRNGGFMVLTK